ncbi:MAG: high-potential iron-sulfur protein [Bdellovibrionaceae bacterium]|nr:high-potential iron-sulfur protein [Bdellovibrio sp.]
MNRRTFFQSVIATVGAVTVFSSLVEAEERRRGGGTPAASAAPQLVDPKDPAAKAVSYVQKNTEIKDKNLQTDRQGVKFANQKCNGCQFYPKDKEATVAGKKAAPCQLPFAAGRSVVSEGWCSSWAKRA